MTVNRILIHMTLVCVSAVMTNAVRGQESGEIPQSAIDAATARVAASVVQIETVGGLDQVGERAAVSGPTTGTVIDPEGWIVASSFSFQQLPAAIVVRTPDGERHAAKLVARDRNRELVLLKTDPNSQFKAITSVSESDIRVGETAIALGKVFDPARPSASVGIVSALGRVWGKAVQTDARISPNNYGGPLIDLRGRCLGILVPLNPGDGTDSDGSQWYDSGIGFAVPLGQILRSFEKWKQGEDILPGRVGVTLTLRDDYSGPVVVAGAAANSPAAKIGLKRGDRILEVNEQPIEIVANFKSQLGKLNAGDSVKLKLQRGDETLDLQCELAAEIPPYRWPFLGILPAWDGNGNVTVKEIVPESPAAKAGLEEGDLLVDVAGNLIDSVDKLRELILTTPADQKFSLRVQKKNTAVSDSRVVELSLDVWPTDPMVKLKEDVGQELIAKDGAAGTGIVDLPLGDAANKCFAFVPPSYTPTVPHGVLFLLPEAGKIDQRAVLDQWEPLCRKHRWILVVLTSADEKAWTIEEAELVGRLFTKIKTNYTIDKGRVAAVGIRSASPLAALVAFSQRKNFNALVLLGGNFPQRLQIEAAQPLESVRSLIVSEETDGAVAEKLTDSGYPAGTLQGEVPAGGTLAAPLAEIVNLWLRGLERL